MSSKAEQQKNKLKQMTNRFANAKSITGEGASTSTPLSNESLPQSTQHNKPDTTISPENNAHDTFQETTTTLDSSLEVNQSTLLTVPLDSLYDNPYNARTVYDPEVVKDRASSISAAKQIVPIKVIPNLKKDGTYIIIDGHYRKRALQFLRHTSALVVIDPTPLTDAQMYVQSFMSNHSRSPQTVYDNAVSWQSLLKNKVFASYDDLANAIQVSKTNIAKTMSIFNLPDTAIEVIKDTPSKFSQRSLYDLYRFWEKNQDLAFLMQMVNMLSTSENSVDISSYIERYSKKKERKPRTSTRKHTLMFHDSDVGHLKDWGTGRLTLDLNLDPTKKEEFLTHISNFMKLK